MRRDGQRKSSVGDAAERFGSMPNER